MFWFTLGFVCGIIVYVVFIRPYPILTEKIDAMSNAVVNFIRNLFKRKEK